jgi:hypothetical protein
METLIKMYLDYVNKFITVDKFAEWHGVEPDEARILLDMGKKYHEQKAERQKLFVK